MESAGRIPQSSSADTSIRSGTAGSFVHWVSQARIRWKGCGVSVFSSLLLVGVVYGFVSLLRRISSLERQVDSLNEDLRSSVALIRLADVERRVLDLERRPVAIPVVTESPVVDHVASSRPTAVVSKPPVAARSSAAVPAARAADTGGGPLCGGSTDTVGAVGASRHPDACRTTDSRSALASARDRVAPATPTPVVPPVLAPVVPPPAPAQVAQADPLASCSRPPTISLWRSIAGESAFARACQEMSGRAVVGGSWLNKLGVSVLVVGVALLLGYSFARLGPLGRVSLGLAISLSMLLSGVWVERRERYVVFARGLIGGGWAALYFTAYAMHGLETTRIVQNPVLGTAILFVVAAGNDWPPRCGITRRRLPASRTSWHSSPWRLAAFRCSRWSHRCHSRRRCLSSRADSPGRR